jgi:nucleotide-binding universal stress UspA family protein
MLCAILKDRGMSVTTAESHTRHLLLGYPYLAVRIACTDIPAARRMLAEHPGYEARYRIDTKKLAKSRGLLVPIDFSPYSDLACDFAFALAQQMDCSITLLHVFFSPSFPTPFPDADTVDAEIEEQQVTVEVEDEVSKRVEAYKTKLRERIAAGELPDVPFEFVVEEGIPEEEISRLTRNEHPSLVVMGTRGRHRKELDLLGSVTAEVIDSASAPVFAIPENSTVRKPDDVRRLAFVTNFDDRDMLGLQRLLEMNEFTERYIHFLYVTKKNDENEIIGILERVRRYFEDFYPEMEFNIEYISEEDLLRDADKIISENNIDVLVLTTHKRNVFARLFNPSLAHRVVFHSDTPLLIIRN